MRLIDADKLIEELEGWYKHCGGTTNQRDWIIQDAISSAMDTVNEAETIDAEPVRHGEWFMHEITDPHGFMHTRYYKCSLCGRREAKKEPFCHCGAKMDGGEQDD